jgi:hypothetical protein
MADFCSNFNWTNATPVLGSMLAHTRLHKQLRALQAVVGATILYKPTPPQAAALWGISPAYVHLALQVLHDESQVTRIRRGERSLADAAARVRKSKSIAAPDPWTVAEDLVHLHGVDQVFDRLILPALA